jgi:hypothetical protein
MDATQFYVQQEVRKVESAAHAALSRLRRARTLREVVEASHVPVPPAIRFMSRQIHGLRTLEQAAERRAREVVEVQLAEAKALPPEELQSRLRILRTREWMLLRGNFPSLVGFTEAESRKLAVQTRTANRGEDDPAESHDPFLTGTRSRADGE